MLETLIYTALTTTAKDGSSATSKSQSSEFKWVAVLFEVSKLRWRLGGEERSSQQKCRNVHGRDV